MKKVSKQKSVVLIFAGIVVVAISQMVTQFGNLTDLANGSIMGIGIGILLIALLFGKYKTA